MKITFAAALFAVAVSANEAEAEKVGYADDYYCDVESFLDQVYLDTSKYQALSAQCKQDIIWERVLRSKEVQRFFTGNDMQDWFDDDLNVDYDTVSDTRPIGRVKKLFPRGVITMTEFVPAYGHDYTGVFRGSKNVVQRICEYTMTTPEVPKTSPGLELKFLRDGMSSANTVMQFAFDGQPSFNYFKNRVSNVIREMDNTCMRETMGKKLAEASDFIGAWSIMEMALYDSAGKEEKRPNWPFMIEAEPYDTYGWTDAYQNDFNE